MEYCVNLNYPFCSTKTAYVSVHSDDLKFFFNIESIDTMGVLVSNNFIMIWF